MCLVPSASQPLKPIQYQAMPDHEWLPRRDVDISNPGIKNPKFNSAEILCLKFSNKAGEEYLD